jgi:hypothetical protein
MKEGREGRGQGRWTPCLIERSKGGRGGGQREYGEV